MTAAEADEEAEAKVIAAVDTFKTLAQIPSVVSAEFHRGDGTDSREYEAAKARI